MVQPTPSLHTWKRQPKSIILIWIVITLNQTHRLKKTTLPNTNKTTCTQTHNPKAPIHPIMLSHEIDKFSNYFLKKSMFFKEPSLVPMSEGP